MNENFARIDRLPTYVFAITNELKAKARAKGEDIIDFGMGNPDQPTPTHIVEKDEQILTATLLQEASLAFAGQSLIGIKTGME
jgi:aspartate/methionine/tyrosine aminotransferase